jgi:hypothetical protein
VGIAAVRFALFGTVGGRFEWQRCRRRRGYGSFCIGQRRIFDGWALALVARAGAKLWAMGHTYRRFGAFRQLRLGALDGLGAQHRTLVFDFVGLVRANIKRKAVSQ